ncbi:unnamed protein product [Lathyrus sativus]|nr:unnamed protein product [Lathyrus sativus]
MGDSGCLMQPFCYASGISNEANENNTNHALGQSISFGRFMTETLAWEKWSSFTQNRYVEEAEKYSKPGSVAQKKAFFEAHYKKLAAQKAAAALLEQEANNAAAQNNVAEQQENNEKVDESPKYEIVVKEEQDTNVLSNDVKEEQDTKVSESNKLEEDVLRNSMMVELRKKIENVDTLEKLSEKLSGTTPIMTPVLKDVSNYDQEVLASTSKKKPPVSSYKLLKANHGTSKFTTTTPVKSTSPISFKIDSFATPTMSNNKPSALSNADKKRSTPKKVNFTPIREFNRLTASVRRRFESTKVGSSSSSSKVSKDSLTPLRTSTMASKEMQKHSTLTPLTENKRNKTPIDSSASRNHTSGPKWRLLSGEKKTRSPIISSPFSLRTEERAATRKKKLEEKFNANEVQKVQLHTKLKAKAGTEIRKLRQSFCFQARPLPDFYKERKASNIETRKVPQTHSEPPNVGRYLTTSMAECKTSLTPNKSSLKNNSTKNFMGKGGGHHHTLTNHHPQTSNSMKIITTHENASPNIQHRSQNGRIYK